MIERTKLTLVAVAVMALLGAATAVAAEKRDHLGDFRDWSTFKDQREDGTVICYMVSKPEQSTLSERTAKRRQPYFMVTHWPSRGERGVVSLSAGTKLRANVAVVVSVEGRNFDLYADEDMAWTYGLEDDAKMVEAMKSGLKLGVRATAAGGFTTNDNYSLRGFTAAYNRISEACR